MAERRRNAKRGDESIRRLERQVLAGDFLAVTALAAAYERKSRGRAITSVVLREDEPPFAVLVFEHPAGMDADDVAKAARSAIRDALAAARSRQARSKSARSRLPGNFCWGDAPDFLSPEDWSRHELVLIDAGAATVDRFETFVDPDDGTVVGDTVEAEVHTDDGEAEAEFDAAPWLAQATQEEVVDLAECGWGGGYPSDAVAEWMADHDEDVRSVFRRVRRRDTGFECHVNEEQARSWLQRHRPDVFAALPPEDDDE